MDQVGSYGVLGVHVRLTGEVRVRVTDIYVRHWEWCKSGGGIEVISL